MALDSAFAMALVRLAQSRAWSDAYVDSATYRYSLRAGANNRGQAPRESLLVAAESLRATLYWTEVARPAGLMTVVGTGAALLSAPRPEICGTARYEPGFSHPGAGVGWRDAHDEWRSGDADTPV